MMFVLLIAVASALQFQSQEANCGYIANVCDGVTACMGVEAYIDGCVAEKFGINSSIVLGVPVTAVAQAYAMCAMGVNVAGGGNDMPGTITDLYECECENAANNACSWPEASAITDSTAVCLQDAACVAAWEDIVTSTTDDGVSWDPAAIGLQIPSSTNNYDQNCKVFFAAAEKENVKAMHLGMALFATGMPAGVGDATVKECNVIMMDDIKTEVGKLIMKVAGGVGAGAFFFTLIGTCVYFKCFSNKVTSM